jgi:DNA-directed RNA polymerase specialized sigma24 family protein
MMIVTNEGTSEGGQAGRLGELYSRYSPGAGRLAYLLTGDRHTAEDLVQEAFVRVFSRFRDLRRRIGGAETVLTRAPMWSRRGESNP